MRKNNVLTACRKISETIDADALYITNPANLRRISGFSGEGYLLITRERQILVTDSRYTIAAKAQCPEWKVIDMVGEKLGMFRKVCRSSQVHKVAYEDKDLSCFAFFQCKKAIDDASLHFVPLGDQITKLRQIKTQEEIEKIKKAEAIGDLAFEAICKALHVGMREREVAAMLEYEMKTRGADGLSFATIAASGEHSAMPHAEPDDRMLQNGDFLTMDFGCLYEGYCSDMTRTVVIGTASQKQKEIYGIVLEAQKRAIESIRPGMKGKEVDAIARDYICQCGYGGYFGHGLGHSVGLEIHETPTFSTREEQTIEPGMVITVEPGIYVEGFGGVRIEDVVCITEDGCENITHSPKNLIEIEVTKI